MMLDRRRLLQGGTALMLAAPGAARRNRTGIRSLGGWHTGRCVSAARWLPQVTILPLIRFRDALILSQLESHGREAGTRTPSTWSQTRRANPYATSR